MKASTLSGIVLAGLAAIVAFIFLRKPSAGSAAASAAAQRPPSSTAPTTSTPIPTGASQSTALGIAAINAAPGIVDSLSSWLSGSSDDAEALAE